jgi:T5SS/PEP-CTERM-associated repeat protein
LVVDVLILTNSCGLFIKTGGTLSATTTNLAPSLSAVGDGIPNSWKVTYGFDPFDPTVASQDPDGDGLTNAQEFANGSDPLVNSVFNSWIFGGNGIWAESNKWSSGTPPDTGTETILITNAVTKTVTYNSSVLPANQVVSNLTISAPVGALNTLVLTNAAATPLTVLDSLVVSSQGALLVSNSQVSTRQLLLGPTAGGAATVIFAGKTNLVTESVHVGAAAGATGTVTLASGGLVVTNGALIVGEEGAGQLRITDGRILATNVQIGVTGSGNGTLTMAAGGTFDAPKLAIFGPLTLGDRLSATGTLWLSAGTLMITNTPSEVGNPAGLYVDGAIIINAGSSIVVSNIQTAIGNTGSGSVLINGGSLVSTGSVNVGRLAGGNGTLTLAGGRLQPASLTVGVVNGSTGTVWVTGGELLATNGVGNITVSSASLKGELTLSNGVIRASTLRVNSTGGNGTFTMAGGTVVVNSLLISDSSGGFGQLWMKDGSLLATGTSTEVNLARFGTGLMVVSNGTQFARAINVGIISGLGTLTMAGGTNHVWTAYTLGSTNCTGSGIGQLTSGTLFITNVAGTARLEVRSGSFHQSGGTLIVDRIVLTNACGTFTRSGGTFQYGTAILSPDADQDGDGIPNAWEQANGLEPFDPTDAEQDFDGDGFTNRQEYLAGTDPNDAGSAFRITSIVREGNDLRITWQTGLGKTNALLAGTTVTNIVMEIFAVTNTTGSVTNYLHSGALTNVPGQFYRIRLVP